MTEDEIKKQVNLTIQGDTKAFAHLVHCFQPMIFQLAFRLLYNEEDAKDIVQEVFIKIWRSIATFDNSCKFSTWIYRISTNACYDRMRRTGFQPERKSKDIDLSSLRIFSENEADSSIINSELKEVIQILTEELSPKQKVIFTLSELDELSVSEIISITGLTPEKIKSNLYLAKKHIKEKIRKLGY